MATSLAARGLATAGALALLALVLVPGLDLFPEDPVLGAAALAAGLPFAAFLAWIAVAPDHADRRLGAIGVDLSSGRDLAGLAVHVVFAWLVFGGTVLQTGRALSRYLATGRHPASSQALGDVGIVFNLLVAMVLFVVAALTWLRLVEDREVVSIVEELRLDPEGVPRGIAYGLAVTLAGFVVLAAAGLVMQRLGVQPSNPQADAIAAALSPATAVLVAALAGVGEEFYFRGFLLDRVGNLGQASLFALVHATYLTATQVLLPFALGLAFGWVVRRTNLWTAIVSHTSFNAVMLFIQIHARDAELALALLA